MMPGIKNEQLFMANTKIAKVVREVLRMKMKSGVTTKNAIVLMAYKKIEKLGGPTKFGIGAAAMMMALHHLLEIETTRQMKMPLTDHDAVFRMPVGVRADLKAIMVKIPRWIAIEKGKDALWMAALKARPEHWEANGTLKVDIAEATFNKADVSFEARDYLRANGFQSFEEAIAAK